jgi:hypothetical protein
MTMLPPTRQIIAALHARLGASGFDRRFGGLITEKGCTVVFIRPIRAIPQAADPSEIVEPQKASQKA